MCDTFKLKRVPYLKVISGLNQWIFTFTCRYIFNLKVSHVHLLLCSYAMTHLHTILENIVLVIPLYCNKYVIVYCHRMEIFSSDNRFNPF